MSIEQNEIELKKLLTRVMRDPLQPLQVQLDQTGKDVTHLDEQLRNLREVEMGEICARLDDVKKVLNRLHDWAGDNAADKVMTAILPPMQGALDTLTRRIDSHTESIAQPLLTICQEVAQTATAVERLAEHSMQAGDLAAQRDASLGDQVRDISAQQAEHSHITQLNVRQATDAAIERLSAMFSSATTAQHSKLQQLVEVEISKRIDQLVEQSIKERDLAVQRGASLGDQVRDISTQQAEHWHRTQVHVREATDSAVERLGAMSASTTTANQLNLQRLVEVEVSRRIDKLITLGRWTAGLAVAAVCAATACLALLARSLQ